MNSNARRMNYYARIKPTARHKLAENQWESVLYVIFSAILPRAHTTRAMCGMHMKSRNSCQAD